MANRTISLAAIKTLQESHALLSKSAGALKFAPNKTFNERISLWQGDITLLGVDAVVNAANKSLLGGGGIDGAIHRAAGRKLLNECRTLGGCETGDAKITGGYNLPARHVIHTVGPIGEIPNKLSSCYRRVLEVVKENNLTSVAFCCISTGIYGYDNSKAAHVALETVREWMEDNHEYVEQLERIVFCTFLDKDKNIYEELAPKYFPAARSD